MKLRDTLETSIKQFYNGKLPSQLIEASDEEYIFTMEYFDGLLEDDEDEDEAA